ncbi:dTDP-4-dehydrorhamnose 3,5-epimerase [Oleispirillum naphthae]|uniref:dTDP-4-dehydrorhamnose 3,5-epimerase n=1 Tax=Oleispirillum naphthae TaxID=2838853 RepID=UPI00308255AF
MNIMPTEFDGVLVVEPGRFGDGRGFFSETYNRRQWAEAGIDADFVQDNQSLSAARGTVRGMHWQAPPHAQAKLIRVTRGAILDVVVDIRRGSPTFGRHLAVELSAENWRQLFIPAGFAHGFCTLTENVEAIYKVDAYYAPEAEGGFLWNDPALGIAWPVAAEAAALSAKDRALPAFGAARIPDFTQGGRERR